MTTVCGYRAIFQDAIEALSKRSCNFDDQVYLPHSDVNSQRRYFSKLSFSPAIHNSHVIQKTFKPAQRISLACQPNLVIVWLATWTNCYHSECCTCRILPSSPLNFHPPPRYEAALHYVTTHCYLPFSKPEHCLGTENRVPTHQPNTDVPPKVPPPS